MTTSRMAALVALLLAFGVLLAPVTAFADSPQEQLDVLAKHVDAAVEKLAAGDRTGSRSEYTVFNSGWADIEDGIRAVSRPSYRAIEDSMAEVREAYRTEPFSPENATAELRELRGKVDAFVKGIPEAATSAPSTEPATLPSTIGHIDRALALLDAGNVVAASTEVNAFRADWTEVEGLVKVKSPGAYAVTENNMALAYSLLTQRTPDVDGARRVLSSMKSDLAPFAQGEARYGVFDAMIILLREGVEALLVIGALFAFLKKTGNGSKSRWIWAGSGAGVLASIIVAFVVTIAFSQVKAGSSRELLEGVTGLFAAGMLIYMSFWLHSKSSLGAWHKYISGKTSAALARNSLMSLALIAFLAVFREGAETVLFYVGIAPATAVGDLALGVGLGTAGLVVVGTAILLLGARIPIRPFFQVTSVLVYYLAFKFVGTGIHALQVAGKLRATPSDLLPSNQFFGVYPTWETTVVQVLLLGGAVAWLVYGLLRKANRPAARVEPSEAVSGGSK